MSEQSYRLWDKRSLEKLFKEHLQSIGWERFDEFPFVLFSGERKMGPMRTEDAQAGDLKKSSQWPHLKMFLSHRLAFFLHPGFPEGRRHFPRICAFLPLARSSQNSYSSQFLGCASFPPKRESGDHFPPLFTSYSLLWNVRNKTLTDSNNPIQF